MTLAAARQLVPHSMDIIWGRPQPDLRSVNVGDC